MLTWNDKHHQRIPHISFAPYFERYVFIVMYIQTVIMIAIHVVFNSWSCCLWPLNVVTQKFGYTENHVTVPSSKIGMVIFPFKLYTHVAIETSGASWLTSYFLTQKLFFRSESKQHNTIRLLNFLLIITYISVFFASSMAALHLAHKSYAPYYLYQTIFSSTSVQIAITCKFTLAEADSTVPNKVF